ncbi:MAG: DUF255 domain-containing protein [Proteobacteria bacterium]|nr:DUF255 domain-containing protein [Pseudomonadota bacterium]
MRSTLTFWLIVWIATSIVLPVRSYAVASRTDEIPDSPEEIVSFKADFRPYSIRPSEKLRLVVETNLKPGWHIYSVLPPDDVDAPPPTKIEIEPGLFIEDGPVYETRPIVEFVKVLGLNIAYHSHQAYFYQNLQLVADQAPESRSASDGIRSAKIEIHYQLCTDTICLPKDSRELAASYRMEDGPPRPEFLVADRSINAVPKNMGTERLAGMLSGGIWAFVGLAALMGLVSLLTPCVFPMIPITVSYFSKQAEGRQTRVVKLAILFALGIVFTYTGTGLLLSVVFGAGSALRLASNPFVNLTIAVVFILFALSLMGLFEIRLPRGLEGYFDRKARTLGGATGVLLMGFTFTLTAFTCTVQFVGTMLIAAAQGEWIWPLLGMLVFSSVFAFPFFLLAIAPSLVKKMQGKSGQWLGRSKVVLGILELMASVKFLSNTDLIWQTNLISRNTAITIWMLLMGGIVVYLAWTAVRPALNKSVVQWAVILGFAGTIALLGRGWNDRSLGSLIDSVLPPPSGLHLSSDDFVDAEEAHKVKWLDSFEEAEKLAKIENKPILLEFTGYTCVNCRWMEQNILARKDVHRQLATNYVLVRLFTDGGDRASENLRLQIDRFNTVALPFYVILSNKNTPPKRFSGISLNPQDFLDFLAL